MCVCIYVLCVCVLVHGYACVHLCVYGFVHGFVRTCMDSSGSVYVCLSNRAYVHVCSYSIKAYKGTPASVSTFSKAQVIIVQWPRLHVLDHFICIMYVVLQIMVPMKTHAYNSLLV